MRTSWQLGFTLKELGGAIKSYRPQYPARMTNGKLITRESLNALML